MAYDTTEYLVHCEFKLSVAIEPMQFTIRCARLIAADGSVRITRRVQIDINQTCEMLSVSCEIHYRNWIRGLR